MVPETVITSKHFNRKSVQKTVIKLFCTISSRIESWASLAIRDLHVQIRSQLQLHEIAHDLDSVSFYPLRSIGVTRLFFFAALALFSFSAEHFTPSDLWWGCRLPGKGDATAIKRERNLDAAFYWLQLCSFRRSVWLVSFIRLYLRS